MGQTHIFDSGLIDLFRYTWFKGTILSTDQICLRIVLIIRPYMGHTSIARIDPGYIHLPQSKIILHMDIWCTGVMQKC
jgi:hypothetical protein